MTNRTAPAELYLFRLYADRFFTPSRVFATEAESLLQAQYAADEAIRDTGEVYYSHSFVRIPLAQGEVR